MRTLLAHFDISLGINVCGWDVSSWGYREFAVPYWNEVISKKKNLFLIFLFDLWNLLQTLNILEKRMTVIANVFPRLHIFKDLVRPLSKINHFRTSLNSQYVQGSQTLMKSAWEHFYNIFSSLWGEMILKISPLLNLKYEEFLLTRWVSMISILLK